MADRIVYPNDGRHARQGIALRCLFLGRNGAFHASGLEVTEHNDVVTMTPITGKGRPARCFIEIPKDAETLRALAARLLAIAIRK